jgi:predicted TPR repeat methyltransferase
MVDTSEVAIAIAEERAASVNVAVSFVHADLTVDSPPAGPWDLALIVHYLQRDLFPKVVEQLAADGLLAFSVATKRNLERHDRPGLPYVLDEGEAPSLVDGLDIIHYAEGWSIEDRHEARLVARRRTS